MCRISHFVSSTKKRRRRGRRGREEDGDDDGGGEKGKLIRVIFTFSYCDGSCFSMGLFQSIFSSWFPFHSGAATAAAAAPAASAYSLFAGSLVRLLVLSYSSLLVSFLRKNSTHRAQQVGKPALASSQSAQPLSSSMRTARWCSARDQSVLPIGARPASALNWKKRTSHLISQ